MPATGVLAPERILVAVRAMAPVTGMPPNRGLAILANPCATNSALELWRSPLMESATTAESRLSSAARMATVSADGSRGRIKSARNCGMWIGGRARLMPPNLLPMVSRGKWKRAATKVAASSATIEPGTRGNSLGMKMISAREPRPTASAGKLVVPMWSARARMRAKNSLGF